MAETFKRRMDLLPVSSMLGVVRPSSVVTRPLLSSVFLSKPSAASPFPHSGPLPLPPSQPLPGGITPLYRSLCLVPGFENNNFVGKCRASRRTGRQRDEHAQKRRRSIARFPLCAWFFWATSFTSLHFAHNTPPHTHTNTPFNSWTPSLPGGLCNNDRANRGSVRSDPYQVGGSNGQDGGRVGVWGAGTEGDLKVKHKLAREHTNTRTHALDWECVCGASITVRHGGWAH